MHSKPSQPAGQETSALMAQTLGRPEPQGVRPTSVVSLKCAA